MTIETKYNIGDEVWVSEDDIPTPKIVARVTANIGKWGHLLSKHIWYRVEDGYIYEEDRLFPTKEELLKSL